jgi:hypothetical protein
MLIDIDHLTEQELLELNHQIVQRLKFLENARAHLAMMEFRPGERVHFNPEGRTAVTGTITKLNQKTVAVLTEDGKRWKVAPSLLHKGGARAATIEDGNIVPIRNKEER